MGLPLWALIGMQGFRLPLELLLHQWWTEGTVPIQITFRSENLDILTGILALAAGVALWRGWLGRRGAGVVNLIGVGLLLNVARIVLRTAPTPFQILTDEPVLELIYHAPYVWIATVCVAAAFTAHILVFRRLRVDQAASQRAAA
ncbi:MAG: hypothetical protein ACI8RZ_004235 [Myxococcota bacterium]|jgi:hypothetical protein